MFDVVDSLHDPQPTVSAVARGPGGGNSLDDIVIDVDTSPYRNPLAPSPKASSRKTTAKDSSKNKTAYSSLNDRRDPSEDDIEMGDLESGDFDMSTAPPELCGEWHVLCIVLTIF